MKHNCPNCDKEFGKRKKGNCPHCGIKLNLIREKQGTLNVVKYTYNKPNVPEVKKIDPSVLFDRADIKIVKIDDKRWFILYRALPQNGVCPNCRQVIFKHPRFLDGEIEMKCPRCKHMLDIEFRILARQKFIQSAT